MFPVYNLKAVDKPESAFRSIEYVETKPILDTKIHDNLNYDDEVNRLLDQVEEEFLRDKPEKCIISEKDTQDILSDKPKNYDFPEDTHHVGSIPDWYRDMLKNKIQEAKSRLESLSNLVCATSPSTAAHIKRIEEDHSTAFCKMDYPRHPPMHKSWRSTWEFCYVQKCKETDSSNHIHSDDCEDVVVEDVETGVRVNSPNVSQHDYPQHVICAARLFRKFAKKMSKKINKSKSQKKSECEEKSEFKDRSKFKGIHHNVDIIEDDWWQTMTMVLISNHLNELMIVVRRVNVTSLIPHLKSYFQSVIRVHPNIVSVLAFHAAKRRSEVRYQGLNNVCRKNRNKEKLRIAGTPVLKDEIGPLSMQYDLDSHRLFFDTVGTMQLGKVIQDYMCLTKETTLLDIASNFGALSLILAHKCEKVIKLIAEPRSKWLVSESEKLKKANQIHNVLFTTFTTANVMTICEPLIEQCITVAVVKLKATPRLGGPLDELMKALRNLPSIWRVILYGSFTDQLHESIAVLTSEDNSMGERYLPMQGCILDRSPTIVNAFDLVILFERKSLIAPEIELFAPGPTVNVAVDSETSDDSMDAQDVKFELPTGGDRELARLPLSTNDLYVPSLSEIKEFRFDHPPPPPTRFPSPPPPPPLPLPDETDLLDKDSNASSYSTTVIGERVQACEKEKISKIVKSAEDVISSVVIKSEPIDPSYSTVFPEANSTLPETNCDSPTTTVKDELVQVCEEKVSEIVSTTEDLISSVGIKLEPIDPSYSAALLEDNNTLSEASCYSATTTVKTEPLQDEVKKESNIADCETVGKAELLQGEKSFSAIFSDTNCQNIAVPVTDVSESTYFSPIRSPDCEPMDMQISPSPPDFQSMETPIHNPRVLSDINPMSVSKNISVEGLELLVQTNQSFLVKVKPVAVDREPGEISDSDGENEAIGEEKNKALIVSRKLNRPPRPFPGKYSESPYKRQNHRKSPSPKRIIISPSPDKRRRRSPSSDRRRERSRRSPLREAHGRAQSSRDRRSRRSRSRSPRRR